MYRKESKNLFPCFSSQNKVNFGVLFVCLFICLFVCIFFWFIIFFCCDFQLFPTIFTSPAPHWKMEVFSLKFVFLCRSDCFTNPIQTDSFICARTSLFHNSLYPVFPPIGILMIMHIVRKKSTVTDFYADVSSHVWVDAGCRWEIPIWYILVLLIEWKD